MSIQIGTNSYVTIAQADTFITENFIASNEQRVAWQATSDADKETYLRNAAQAMERLRFAGKKCDDNQAMSFPRQMHHTTQKEVPQDVKDAQVYEAMELLSPTTASQVKSTATGAVRGFSLGQISENYKSYGAHGVEAIIASAQARQILSCYLGGGYNVM